MFLITLCVVTHDRTPRKGALVWLLDMPSRYCSFWMDTAKLFVLPLFLHKKWYIRSISRSTSPLYGFNHRICRGSITREANIFHEFIHVGKGWKRVVLPPQWTLEFPLGPSKSHKTPCFASTGLSAWRRFMPKSWKRSCVRAWKSSPKSTNVWRSQLEGMGGFGMFSLPKTGHEFVPEKGTISIYGIRTSSKHWFSGE